MSLVRHPGGWGKGVTGYVTFTGYTQGESCQTPWGGGASLATSPSLDTHKVSLVRHPGGWGEGVTGYVTFTGYTQGESCQTPWGVGGGRHWLRHLHWIHTREEGVTGYVTFTGYTQGESCQTPWGGGGGASLATSPSLDTHKVSLVRHPGGGGRHWLRHPPWIHTR